MAVTVNGTVELRNWLLGFGSNVEVLSPPAFRKEVAEEATKMALLYAPERGD
jgi:predicted DNA-binding transcriptional regulator YafY